MRTSYDVVVIGAGIGGLAAAGRMARAGLRVLVLERHSVVGGCCSGFRRGRFLFDAAVRDTGGCAPGDVIHRWLDEMGVLGQVRFELLDPFYTLAVGGERIPVSSHLQELGRTLANLSPADAGAVRTLIAELTDLGQAFVEDRGNSLKRTLALERIGPRSWSEYLAGRFASERVPAVLSALAGYVGTEPDRLAASVMVPFLYHASWGHRFPVGGFQAFADLMARAVRNQGGEVRCRTPVCQVLMEEGRAAGVRLESGEEVRCRVVVSGADAERTFFEWVGLQHLPERFQRGFRQMERAPSAVVLYLGVQQGAWRAPSHTTMVLPGWHPPTAAEFYYRPGGAPPYFMVNVPSLTDPTLAPAGHHTVCVTAIVRPEILEPLRDARGKEFIAQDLLLHLEEVLPGITGSVRFHELATPRTFERFTNNRFGSMYGWAKSISQPWGKGIGPQTPVPGLYLAGHWVRGLHGVPGALVSGCQTAETILTALR